MEVKSKRARVEFVVVLVVLLAGVAVWGGWLAMRGTEPSAEPERFSVTITPTPTTESPTADPAAKRIAAGVVIKRRPYCEANAPRPITPLRMAIEHVTSSAPVLALPRDGYGIPGVPPVSNSGKLAFGWDAPGLRPGVAQGNAIMTAHTYPDGSAMGNFLLARLQEGDRITVFGPGKEQLCYRVFDRVEIPFNADGTRFYDTDGPHDLVFIVCSGTRLGPGEWTHRTIWYSRLVRQRS